MDSTTFTNILLRFGNYISRIRQDRMRQACFIFKVIFCNKLRFLSGSMHYGKLHLFYAKHIFQGICKSNYMSHVLSIVLMIIQSLRYLIFGFVIWFHCIPCSCNRKTCKEKSYMVNGAYGMECEFNIIHLLNGLKYIMHVLFILFDAFHARLLVDLKNQR